MQKRFLPGRPSEERWDLRPRPLSENPRFGRRERRDGRKAPHTLTLSNHKSFLETLIHFTKRARASSN